jgi:hypothetical protein
MFCLRNQQMEDKPIIQPCVIALKELELAKEGLVTLAEPCCPESEPSSRLCGQIEGWGAAKPPHPFIARQDRHRSALQNQATGMAFGG